MTVTKLELLFYLFAIAVLEREKQLNIFLFDAVMFDRIDSLGQFCHQQFHASVNEH